MRVKNPLPIPRSVRAGLTLLEVIVAMAIFLVSSVGIYYAIAQGGQNAVNVQMQARASMLCQSKMAEVIIGAEEAGSGEITEGGRGSELVWQWQVDKTAGEIENLWHVSVVVRREGPDGRRFEASMNQMVLDASIRGSTQLHATAAKSSSSSSSNSSDNSSTTGSNTTGGTTTGGSTTGGSTTGGTKTGGTTGGTKTGGTTGGKSSSGAKGGS